MFLKRSITSHSAAALQQVGSSADPMFLQVQIHTETATHSHSLTLVLIVHDTLTTNLFLYAACSPFLLIGNITLLYGISVFFLF